MMTMVRQGLPWWMGFGLLAGLFVLPNLLATPLSKLWLLLPGLDKPTHFLAFCVSVLVVYLATLRLPWPREQRTKLILSATVTFVIAVADEIQQAVLRIGRTAEFGDLVADMAGILVGVVVIRSRELGMKWAAALIFLLLLPVAVVTAKTYRDLDHYNRGMLYEREREYQKARAEYQLALESGFESAQLYNAIAWLDIEFLGADPAQVEPFAARAYALDPDNPDILDTYGWVLVRAGKVHEGLPLLIKAKTKNPKIYCIDLHLGAAYLALGQQDQAVPLLRGQIERTGHDRFGEAALALLAQVEGAGNHHSP
ncbi:MAG: VanZ family protein [Nitrospira sp.]|nr:VanZ family protein [Nitrospira sp.]MCP9442474.1 VanZ family protein [Nitrospira sp.]